MNITDHVRLANASSMLYWWPKIRNLDIPQPKTAYVKVDQRDIIMQLDDPSHRIPQDGEIRKVADSFGYPLFMRSDHISGKHHWKDTCYVQNQDELKSHMYTMADDTFAMCMAGEIGFNAVFIREFLQLEMAGFTVFNGDFPVSKEVRCFIRDGEIECRHPYWFDEAIEEWQHTVKEIENHYKMMEQVGGSAFSPPKRNIPKNWRRMLKKMNVLTDDDVSTIDRHLGLVGREFDGYWSVDFAKGVNGTWYLIDMAHGEVSYHLADCGQVSEDKAPQRQNAKPSPDNKLCGTDGGGVCEVL